MRVRWVPNTRKMRPQSDRSVTLGSFCLLATLQLHRTIRRNRYRVRNREDMLNHKFQSGSDRII